MRKSFIAGGAVILLGVASLVIIPRWSGHERTRPQRDAPAGAKAEETVSDGKQAAAPDEPRTGPAKNPDAPAADRLTPDEAKRRLAEANRMTSIFERSKACSAIIEELCKSGYPEEAWGLVEHGLGQVRKWQVTAFFRSAGLPDEALYRKFHELNDESEVSFGVNGLISRHLGGDWVTYLQSGNFKAFLKDLKESGYAINLNNSLSPALQDHISDFGEKDTAAQRAKLDQIVIACRDKLIDGTTLTDVLNTAHLLSAREKIEAMDALKDLGPANGNLQVYRRRLIADLVRHDPQGTISKTLAQPVTTQTSRDISNSMRAWINADSQAATDWYAKNSAGLTPFQKDSVAGACYLMAMEDGSHDTARKWIDEMTDPRRKAEARGILERALKKKQAQESTLPYPEP